MNKETPARRETEDDDRVAARVVEYLLNHPDFFQRRPEALAALEIRHDAHGAASLLEKQIALLRSKNSGAEVVRSELIEAARTNTNLSIGLHEIALELLRICTHSDSQTAKAGAVAEACQTVFRKRVPEVSLHVYWLKGFFAGAADDAAPDTVLGAVFNERDQRVAALTESLFAAGECSCEPLGAPAHAALFGRFAQSIRSSVATALFEPVTRRRMGILVLTSGDAERFTPGKGTMFLVQLAQLLESAFTPAGIKEERGGGSPREEKA